MGESPATRQLTRRSLERTSQDAPRTLSHPSRASAGERTRFARRTRLSPRRPCAAPRRAVCDVRRGRAQAPAAPARVTRRPHRHAVPARGAGLVRRRESFARRPLTERLGPGRTPSGPRSTGVSRLWPACAGRGRGRCTWRRRWALPRRRGRPASARRLPPRSAGPCDVSRVVRRLRGTPARRGRTGSSIVDGVPRLGRRPCDDSRRRAQPGRQAGSVDPAGRVSSLVNVVCRAFGRAS